MLSCGAPWPARRLRTAVHHAPVAHPASKVITPTEKVPDVVRALRHVKQLPWPIRIRLVSAPGLSALLELCSDPQNCRRVLPAPDRRRAKRDA